MILPFGVDSIRITAPDVVAIVLDDAIVDVVVAVIVFIVFVVAVVVVVVVVVIVVVADAFKDGFGCTE